MAYCTSSALVRTPSSSIIRYLWNSTVRGLISRTAALVRAQLPRILHDREFVDGALALGDIGFVVKDRLVADLLPAIRTVLNGQAFVSPSVDH